MIGGNISAPFIRRPVATTLLTIGMVLAGLIAVRLLPLSPLPQVDYPTISVSATLPGASPETMATSVAAPLERQFAHIAGVTEMTSTSYLGSTSIVLQFDLSRNIDGAARDVQAAINASQSYLPAALPSLPNYRKVNPAEAPILILALTSDTVKKEQMYDAASTILAQKLSQVEGVGQVIVGGASLPAVRVELNPLALSKYGIGLSDVQSVLATTNVNRPKGQLANGEKTWEIKTNDQMHKAELYRPIIVAYQSGAAVKLSDVADVQDSVEDMRNAGLVNGKPAVMVIVFRQPGANIIESVDRVVEILPQLEAAIPGAINLSVVLDRTTTIRASLKDVERTLVISGILVILVVFAFLRHVRSALIPSIAVPISLITTFGVMYLCGYSLDNLSLMALTIATGFVVDDAIVVLENITRHLEQGVPSYKAALIGAREIGFTVLSISVSLVAVFIPILLMGGMLGRLFREFAVTLSAAIMVSLVVSLTATPMMCAYLLKQEGPRTHGRLFNLSARLFDMMHSGYQRSLSWALRRQRLMMTLMLSTIAVSITLFVVIPKGFFPQQDTGRLTGTILAAQDISFQSMKEKMAAIVGIIKMDPAVDSVVAFTGGSGGRATTNTGRMFIALKPLQERKVSADQVIGRLRKKISSVPGAPAYLQAVQDVRAGGRMSGGQYQYTLEGENLEDLMSWGPLIEQRLREIHGIVDVSSDQQNKGLQASLVIDRATASRLGVTTQAVDNTLYSAFGQRQVSIMYTQLNQYHVVMEVEPRFWQRPDTLRHIYVPSSTGALIPLSTFARYEMTQTALAVSHQGQFPAVTLSFNLAPGLALGDAVNLIGAATGKMGLPASIHSSFQGTAQIFQASLANQPLLILAALAAVYIVLGILYESYIHPLTILSTLPSAGVGAFVALLVSGTELTIIALIGLILLIGIVKKNGIMMVDFALEAERNEGKTPEEAIYQSCLLRFRPIMMTTMAALLGAMPLALGFGVGSELRRPLGIAIVGGLIFSQMLTLYTTPVVYLYLDHLRLRVERRKAARKRLAAHGLPAGASDAQ
ncbi:MAG TPA: multidrug efflux RND transporter permease subunit [Syntrophales bacterium]|nr:multidrug efflux RND transporter permease subunit [Syntrophales bacterium]